MGARLARRTPIVGSNRYRFRAGAFLAAGAVFAVAVRRATGAAAARVALAVAFLAGAALAVVFVAAAPLAAVFLAGATFGTLPLATISRKLAPARKAGTEVFLTFTPSPVSGLPAV